MFSQRMTAVADFNLWFGGLPHRRKILVPGNHEYFLEADPSKRSMLTSAFVRRGSAPTTILKGRFHSC
jgi:hypothetical protein